MATVTFSAADDLLYAYLAGEIDHDAAQNLRIQLDDALLARTPKTLVLDLGGVGFMDSSGVGLILGRQRCARSLGGTLRIQHACMLINEGLSNIKDIATLSGYRDPLYFSKVFKNAMMLSPKEYISSVRAGR